MLVLAAVSSRLYAVLVSPLGASSLVCPLLTSHVLHSCLRPFVLTKYPTLYCIITLSVTHSTFRALSHNHYSFTTHRPSHRPLAYNVQQPSPLPAVLVPFASSHEFQWTVCTYYRLHTRHMRRSHRSTTRLPKSPNVAPHRISNNHYHPQRNLALRSTLTTAVWTVQRE